MIPPEKLPRVILAILPAPDRRKLKLGRSDQVRTSTSKYLEGFITCKRHASAFHLNTRRLLLYNFIIPKDYSLSITIRMSTNRASALVMPPSFSHDVQEGLRGAVAIISSYLNNDAREIMLHDLNYGISRLAFGLDISDNPIVTYQNDGLGQYQSIFQGQFDGADDFHEDNHNEQFSRMTEPHPSPLWAGFPTTYSSYTPVSSQTLATPYAQDLSQ